LTDGHYRAWHAGVLTGVWTIIVVFNVGELIGINRFVDLGVAIVLGLLLAHLVEHRVRDERNERDATDL
jgi:uncharacterized oligopeptide transporter (OPT) family protein